MKKQPTVLKKSRVLDVDQEERGKYLTAQVELENGEVVIGHYSAFHWLRPPSEVGKDATRRMSLPPVAVYSGRRSKEV